MGRTNLSRCFPILWKKSHSILDAPYRQCSPSTLLRGGILGTYVELAGMPLLFFGRLAKSCVDDFVRSLASKHVRCVGFEVLNWEDLLSPYSVNRREVLRTPYSVFVREMLTICGRGKSRDTVRVWRD